MEYALRFRKCWRIILATTTLFGASLVPAGQQDELSARRADLTGIADQATGTPFKLHSPMIIEMGFPIGEPHAWRKIKSLAGFKAGQTISLGAWPAKLGREISIPDWYALGRYTCDGVSLREEVTSQGRSWEEPGLRVQELRRVPSGFEVTLEATLYNPKTNHDKLVTLVVEILAAGDQVMATGSRVQKTPANSKSGNNADVAFLLSPDEMRRAEKLRITISTKDY